LEPLEATQGVDKMTQAEKDKKIAEIKARLVAAKKELAKRKNRPADAPKIETEKEIQARKYEAAADALMEYDPATALKYRQEAQALRELPPVDEGQDPETVRFKLVSNSNAIFGMLAKMASNDPQRPVFLELLESIKSEIAADMPSLQRAYVLIKQSDDAITNAGSAGGAVSASTSASTTATESAQSTSIDSQLALNPGTVLDPQTGTVARGGTTSDVATDWFNVLDEDGAKKPVMREGVNYYNMPQDVKKVFDEQIDIWNRTNDTAKRKAAEAKKAKAGEKIADRYSTSFNKSYDKLREIATQITSLKDKFAKGDYNLANFSDLKKTMADGRMTDSDVGLALGLSTSEGFFQNLKSWATGGKAGIGELNDKEAAATAINRTIAEYNQTMQKILTPNFVGTYAEAAKKAYEDRSAATMFVDLPKEFSPVAGGTGGSTKEKETTLERLRRIKAEQKGK